MLLSCKGSLELGLVIPKNNPKMSPSKVKLIASPADSRDIYNIQGKQRHLHKVKCNPQDSARYSQETVYLPLVKMRCLQK